MATRQIHRPCSAAVAPDLLDEAADKLLQQAKSGLFDWQERRRQKTSPLNLGMVEKMMCFTTAKGFIAGKAGKNYPAPLEVVKIIEKSASKGREGALKAEGKGFAKLAKTSVANALIGLFLNDQVIKKKGKKYGKEARSVDTKMEHQGGTKKGVASLLEMGKPKEIQHNSNVPVLR